MRLYKRPRDPKLPREKKTRNDNTRPIMKRFRVPSLKFTWSNILKGIVIGLGILTFLLMATLICVPDPPPDNPEETKPASQPTPGEPISSQSTETLTRDQINERTAEYLGLNLWAENAHRTATQEPENFLAVIFSVPQTTCVEEYRNVLKNRPVLFPEPVREEQSTPEEFQKYLAELDKAQRSIRELQEQHLLKCTQENTRKAETRPWDNLNPQEQEARTRRAMRFLALSIDPPLLMTTNIASSRGILVNAQNNPEFAQFAAEYKTCQTQADGFAEPMTRMKTPQDMAKLWLQAYQHLTSCFNTITNVIFPKEQSQPQELLTEP